eukprot:m.329868 g.329868  ORF g.329868 m.329868 type:complete len:1222 (+) comp16042_c1_seq2:134-3799(+)
METWAQGIGLANASVVFPNGDRYVGQWQNGLRHGSGAYLFANGTSYAGDFYKGVWCGKGTLTYPNGVEFIGEFANGKPTQIGKFTSPDGAVYTMNDGRLTLPNGKVVSLVFCGRNVGPEGYAEGPNSWSSLFHQGMECTCGGMCGPVSGCQCQDCYSLSFMMPNDASAEAASQADAQSEADATSTTSTRAKRAVPIPPGLDEAVVAFLKSHDLHLKRSIWNLHKAQPKLTTEHLKLLSQALQAYPSIKELRLGSNDLQSADMVVVEQLLSENQSLSILKLNQNSIGDNGLMFLSRAVCSHAALTELNLDRCSIKDEGVRHVCVMLSRNKSLQSLRLSRNHFSDSVMERLADTIATHPALQTVTISSTNITDACIPWFRQAAEKSLTLVEMSLKGTKLSREPLDEMELALAPVFAARRTKSVERKGSVSNDSAISGPESAIKKNDTQALTVGQVEPKPNSSAATKTTATSTNAKQLVSSAPPAETTKEVKVKAESAIDVTAVIRQRPSVVTQRKLSSTTLVPETKPKVESKPSVDSGLGEASASSSVKQAQTAAAAASGIQPKAKATPARRGSKTALDSTKLGSPPGQCEPRSESAPTPKGNPKKPARRASKQKLSASEPQASTATAGAGATDSTNSVTLSAGVNASRAGVPATQKAKVIPTAKAQKTAVTKSNSVASAQGTVEAEEAATTSKPVRGKAAAKRKTPGTKAKPPQQSEKEGTNQDAKTEEKSKPGTMAGTKTPRKRAIAAKPVDGKATNATARQTKANITSAAAAASSVNTTPQVEVKPEAGAKQKASTTAQASTSDPAPRKRTIRTKGGNQLTRKLSEATQEGTSSVDSAPAVAAAKKSVDGKKTKAKATAKPSTTASKNQTANKSEIAEPVTPKSVKGKAAKADAAKELPADPCTDSKPPTITESDTKKAVSRRGKMDGAKSSASKGAAATKKATKGSAASKKAAPSASKRRVDEDEEDAASKGTKLKAAHTVASSDTQDRLLDAAEENIRNTNPITGVQAAPEMGLREACELAKSGCADLEDWAIDSSVFLAQANAKRLKATKTLGALTMDDAMAIHLYTQATPFYGALNGLMRCSDRSQLNCFKPILKRLLNALAKLDASQRRVFRGVKADLSQVYTRGLTFVWWAFSSATSELSVLSDETYLGTSGPRTMFQITAKVIDISTYSACPHENEVLLLPGRTFTVQSTLNVGHGLSMIDVVEEEQAPAHVN